MRAARIITEQKKGRRDSIPVAPFAFVGILPAYGWQDGIGWAASINRFGLNSNKLVPAPFWKRIFIGGIDARASCVL